MPPPQATPSNAGAEGSSSLAPAEGVGRKKKKHRAGAKRRNRRKSFAAPSEGTEDPDMTEERPSLLDVPSASAARASFYRLGNAGRSNTSLESEALLDHRDHATMRTRRQSIQQNLFGSRASQQFSRSPEHRRSHANPFLPEPAQNKSRLSRAQGVSASEAEDDDADDRTPLIASQRERPATSRGGSGYGGTGGRPGSRIRRSSTSSSKSRRRDKNAAGRAATVEEEEEYDVNNPPSIPASPHLSGMKFEDVMLDRNMLSTSPRQRTPGPRDAIIDIDDNAANDSYSVSPRSPSAIDHRRRTLANAAEDDVCFPVEGMSEIDEEEFADRRPDGVPQPRRRRTRHWPDLSELEEWARQEKAERDNIENVRAKKISEPVLVQGRLRPQKTQWHREADDAPYRYTYFNEEFDATIHSRTLSELCQLGATFRELFIPDPPELTDETSDEEDDESADHPAPMNGQSKAGTRQSSVMGDRKSGENTGENTPQPPHHEKSKGKRYGPRPTWWLDILSPTEAEMRVICRTFGIHPLTQEDILMQEAREKVELFRNYYFVNYRTFEQDKDSEDYLEPVNMYVVVFREGVLSFHFSMTPHPANVRRRIRQLSDYLILSSDWISYAIIDDITDVYAPLIQLIEDEVDEIDDKILQLHSPQESTDEKPKNKAKDKEVDYEKQSEAGDKSSGDSGGDMLRQVGECRKKVMSLYRLLGNKADVIKGFAKRCTQEWEVAPRSEIGLYLGDIQDHIVTMTANLSHYENLLSRAHSNYLAQINIRMNERQEQTADVLGKLTVLGTIVLPMNIVTGMWGMNVMVPGQDVDSLAWFWGITGMLFAFGLSCYFVAKRVYGIV
ncbi:hypothetical protein B0A49_11298 [Cryomyces minteri]|uniref:Cora-domain-containing protein n=1 Tax=Cryomyces minteri TaxID=331657 RepID=A0A4V5NAT9_9PEZI|nr:hypothetical protein B0A49_11298 [Cryomyces minteri]